eukprot:7175036-Pyramimonas_sp.AAC.1
MASSMVCHGCLYRFLWLVPWLAVASSVASNSAVSSIAMATCMSSYGWFLGLPWSGPRNPTARPTPSYGYFHVFLWPLP